MKHRHMIQIAQALLHHSPLAQRFWGRAVLTTTYITNKLPSIILNWKFPLKILLYKPPDYSRMKVFGCLCFIMTNLDPHKRKFGSRTKKCVFLGYVPNTKGSEVFDIEDNKVILSRDVNFYENYFPYKKILDISDRSSPLLDVIPDNSPFSVPRSTFVLSVVDYLHQNDAIPEVDIPTLEPEDTLQF